MPSVEAIHVPELPAGAGRLMKNTHIPAQLPIQPGSLLSLDELRGPDRYRTECICRAASQAVYLGGHTTLSRVLGRYKMFLDTRDRGFGAHVMLDGYWEMWLTQFIARLVAPGMHVADIGANFGYYSLLMADLVGPAGRLLAVEPNPPVADTLKRTLELNGFASRSTVVAAAAGSGEGEGRLMVPVGEPKNAALVSRAAPNDDGSLVAVPIHSLDMLLRDFPRVDFLKIDAEGAEEDIILGLGQVIERWRPRIVLEFNPGRCRDPQGLLVRLRGFYPVLRCLDYYAQVAPISDQELLDPTNREDRLLYLDRVV
jgi:FkbM family methyltransferase